MNVQKQPIGRTFSWARLGSNQRPLACEAMLHRASAAAKVLQICAKRGDRLAVGFWPISGDFGWV
jgi:hypothetical protein